MSFQGKITWKRPYFNPQIVDFNKITSSIQLNFHVFKFIARKYEKMFKKSN